ncbi:MAG: hypothetical protein NTV68_11780 [Methanomicrobiales archaeon]|nr:hypothetical protein [Methanomicrobiales archaeon]
MILKVILHTTTGLDARFTGFPADLELYYPLAAQRNPDAILFGSETVLAAARDNPAMATGHRSIRRWSDLRMDRPILVPCWLLPGQGTLLGRHPEIALHTGHFGPVFDLNPPAIKDYLR